jgi:predicted dehydrogenase
MTTSPIRIGLVGLDHWYWADSLAGAVAASPDAQIVAIADRESGRAQDAARRYGVERVTGGYEELIEDPQIDAIASFVSVDQNPAVCVAAARSGKHLFSVKPLALTLEEATQILQAVRAAGVIFMPAESATRLSGPVQRVKSWIGEGRLGRVLSATYAQHAGLPKSWPDNDASGWFIEPGRAPGGGWIDHSIYNIDTLRWLLDDEIAQIGGRAERLKYPDLAFEDYGHATLQFNGGTLATVEVTWIAPPGGGRSSWTIIGTEGAVSYDSMTGRFSVAGNFPPFQGWVQTAPQQTFTAGLDHFVAAIRGQAAPIATVEDAWRNLAACLAFYRAAEAGSPIAPQEIDVS